jgi:hypothetical protein
MRGEDRDKRRQHPKILIRMGAFALGILLVTQHSRAQEPAGFDANGNKIASFGALGAPSQPTVHLLQNENLIFAAESEPSMGGKSGEDEETNLAKQLTNPIASLISVPFRQTKILVMGPLTTAINSHSTFNRSSRSRSAKIGT